MLAYPAGLAFKCLVRVFIYTHTLCMRAAKVLVSLRTPEPSLLDNAISTKTLCARQFILEPTTVNAVNLTEHCLEHVERNKKKRH